MRFSGNPLSECFIAQVTKLVRAAPLTAIIRAASAMATIISATSDLDQCKAALSPAQVRFSA